MAPPLLLHRRHGQKIESRAAEVDRQPFADGHGDLFEQPALLATSVEPMKEEGEVNRGILSTGKVIKLGTDPFYDLATGEVHSYGRYKITYGNPPADHTGVNKDIDLRRSHSVERCVKVDSFTPTVNSGYDLYNNNCATYAWSEWKRVSGEDLDKSSLGTGTYDHPDVLKDSIEKMNKKKPRKECECAKPPAKKK